MDLDDVEGVDRPLRGIFFRVAGGKKRFQVNPFIILWLRVVTGLF